MWLCEHRPTEQNHAVAFPIFSRKEMAGHECLNQNHVLNLCWESMRVRVDSKTPFPETFITKWKIKNA